MKYIFLGAAALIGLYMLKQKQEADAAQAARYDILRTFKQTFTPGGSYTDLNRTRFTRTSGSMYY